MNEQEIKDIHRRIFLKRQLIFITEKEISDLEQLLDKQRGKEAETDAD